MLHGWAMEVETERRKPKEETSDEWDGLEREKKEGGKKQQTEQLYFPAAYWAPSFQET